MKECALFVLSFLSIAAMAQFNKGDKFISGSFGFNTQSGNANGFLTQNTVSIGPSLGYFLNEKYAVILGMSYSSSYYEFIGSKNFSTSFAVTPSIRRYFLISDKFYLALSTYLSFYRGNTEQINSFNNQTTQSPYYSLGVGLGPSFIFFPSPNWGLQAGLGSLNYGHYQNLSDARSNNSYGLNWSSLLNFGVTYYFINKK
ncbi:MAG: hypothetical protein JST69_05085 [Bacteroidetes bacterium]|nr:hypothetical protein [Bacteroidota bacterium]